MFSVPTDKQVNGILEDADEAILEMVNALPSTVRNLLKDQPTSFLEGYMVALLDLGSLVLASENDPAEEGMSAEDVQDMLVKAHALAVYCAQQVRANTQLN